MARRPADLRWGLSCSLALCSLGQHRDPRVSQAPAEATLPPTLGHWAWQLTSSRPCFLCKVKTVAAGTWRGVPRESASSPQVVLGPSLRAHQGPCSCSDLGLAQPAPPPMSPLSRLLAPSPHPRGVPAQQPQQAPRSELGAQPRPPAQTQPSAVWSWSGGTVYHGGRDFSVTAIPQQDL